MRRQTANCGVPPAGSSRVIRLDPLSLPVRFSAHDTRADGGIRQVELHRERVILRRAVQGMRMAINVRVSDFLGLALRETEDAKVLVLVHQDPALSIPLHLSADDTELAAACETWSHQLGLSLIEERKPAEPAQRRRRRNAVRFRRPRFLMRRRIGDTARELSIHRGEREIIARS